MVFNLEDQIALVDTLSREPDTYNQYQKIDIIPQQPRRTIPDLGPLPRYSSIIGVCEDGLPLLFDLSNPTVGCILIYGGVQTTKNQLLKSILHSASLLNTPREVNYYVVSPDPGRFAELVDYDHCSGVFSSYERSARELIIELATIAEQRKSGRHTGAVIILAIDDLYTFLKNREFEVDIHLKWLLKHGPNNGVWCIGTLQPEYLSKLNSDHLSSFKTRLIANSYPLALNSGNKQSYPGIQSDTFTAQIGDQSIHFWIPEFD